MIFSQAIAGVQRYLEAARELACHVAQGIVAWLAAQVAHQDDRDATLGDKTRHARIGAQAPDVVDERGASIQRGVGDTGLVGVDREDDHRRERGSERLNHRNDALALDLCGQWQLALGDRAG